MLTPISERAYTRPELVAETGWLADRMPDPRIRVVDARSRNEYAAGHIAGAVHMDGFGSGIPRAENGDMGSPAEFARLVGGLGIDNDTSVIVYDTPSQRMGMVASSSMYASRPPSRNGIGQGTPSSMSTRKSYSLFGSNSPRAAEPVSRTATTPGIGFTRSVTRSMAASRDIG